MEREILEAFERCQRRFPTVQLLLEAFQARVDAILSSELQLEREEERIAAFARIHHEDLFLAIACAQDDRVAWEHFADDYVPLLQHFAAQACGNPSEAEDLAQEITTKLLKEKKRMAGYNGRGSLAGWLRVAVSHAAIDRFRRMNRYTSLESLQESGTEVAFTNPETADQDEALDSRWGRVISKIAEERLRKLTARDRLLLCLYYLRGVTLQDIGRQFGIHEATASRRLDRLRRDIRKDIEKELRKKHRLRSSEIQSLWKLVSPRLLAESIAVGSPGLSVHRPETGRQIQKKSASGEKSGVIEKEELR